MNDVVIENKKMGRKVTLTPDRIIEAIKHLQNNSSEVTPCTIRREIGSGGLGNISNVLASYLKEQNGISVSDNIPIETHILAPALEDKRNMLLSDLTLQVSNFVLESDFLANDLAEKKARSAYENIIKHNQKIAGELTQTIKIFDEVEVKNDQLNEQITEIQTLFENEQVKSSVLNASLSKANDESTRLNLQISETKASLSESTAKNRSLEKLITKAETRLESSITDKEIAVNESTQLRTQFTETSTKFESSEAIVVQLKSEINALITENAQSISD